MGYIIDNTFCYAYNKGVSSVGDNAIVLGTVQQSNNSIFLLEKRSGTTFFSFAFLP